MKYLLFISIFMIKTNVNKILEMLKMDAFAVWSQHYLRLKESRRYLDQYVNKGQLLGIYMYISLL